MIEHLLKIQNTKAFSKLGSYFLENPKIGGELSETFLVESFNRIGIKSEKVAGRQKADICINGTMYSVKSSSLNGAQLDTLSNGGLTLQKIVEAGGQRLVTKKCSSIKLSNHNDIFDLIIKSLDKMPIIFINFKVNDLGIASFHISELTFEDFSKVIRECDTVLYSRPKNRNSVKLIKNNKVVFTIKDGTGTNAANAFQRGIWADDLSFIKNSFDIVNIPVSRISFYEN